jgi:subtilase family serine protease
LALESSLDIEYAHAMAPNAKIYLVEAASNSYADLNQAVSMASSLVAAAGGGQVSMSYGGDEFSGENANDTVFNTTGVVYFASTGDAPGTEYPSVSDKVVGVGGTSISRNPSTGNFVQEGKWQQTGGGPSLYYAKPTYQKGVVAGTQRGAPDVSAVADPDMGAYVYSGYNGGWLIVGGTSLAAPVFAGVVNGAGIFRSSSADFLTFIYANKQLPKTYTFADIANGNCGPYAGYITAAGYDFCTGLGSPRGTLGTH